MDGLPYHPDIFEIIGSHSPPPSVRAGIFFRGKVTFQMTTENAPS